MKFLLLTFLLFSFNVKALTYEIQNDQVILSGSIDESDLIKLPRYITPNINTVIFHDVEGGDAITTLKLLSSFEKRPRTHLVKGYCHSACTLFFLAGNRRELATPNSVLGFHAVYSYDDNKINPELSSLFHKYVASRLGMRYDNNLFEFVFTQIEDFQSFLIFKSKFVGQYCSSDVCTNITSKTAFDLGIITN